MFHSAPFEADWLSPEIAILLVVVIVLAALGTTVLFLFGLAAYSRRRSFRYLIVTVVLGLLVVRSIVGLGTVFGLVPMEVHHLLEHGLDFAIAVLILYAAYQSGSAGGETDFLESDQPSE